MFNYFSDISLWWLLPIGILSIGLSYFYYYKPRIASDWTVRQLRQLFALRSVALFVVGLLLLGLLWESIRYRDEKLFRQRESKTAYPGFSKAAGRAFRG